MKKIVVALIALVVCALAVIFLDIRIMKSQLASDSTTASSKSGDSTAKWEFSPISTGLYVVPGGSLTRHLETEILQAAKNQGGIGRVDVLTTTTEQASFPLLVIEVKKQDIFWTPIYARASLDVEVAYATNGDVTFRHGEVVRFSSSGEIPTFRYKDSYAIADVSWGIISSAGYQNYLASQVAQKVMDSFRTQLGTFRVENYLQ